MQPAPLVSVNIPCYRQLPYARRAVESVLAQTLGDFELNLLDDAASDEYRQYAASLDDRRVRYVANARRLGAMRNMFAAIAAGRGEYVLALHEDDLAGRHYLEAAVELLERDPRRGFVAGQLREFSREPTPDELAQAWDGRSYAPVETAADYLAAIFRGLEPMFGSIVYRRAALAGIEPEHDRYATLVDRPFLISIFERNWTAAIIRAPLVWYRRHEPDDGRHRLMTTTHILRLFERYRAVLRDSGDHEAMTRFESYARAWLVQLYDLTDRDSRPLLARFLFDAWRAGVYRPRLGGHAGVWHLRHRLFTVRTP